MPFAFLLLFFLSNIYCYAFCLSSKSICFPSKICKWLSIGDDCWAKDGPTSFISKTPFGPHPCKICASYVSLWVQICLSPSGFRILSPDVLHTLWLLHSFHLHFYRFSWAPRGGIWWGHPFLRLNVSRSLSLWILFGKGSLYLCTSAAGSFSDDG